MSRQWLRRAFAASVFAALTLPDLHSPPVGTAGVVGSGKLHPLVSRFVASGVARDLEVILQFQPGTDARTVLTLVGGRLVREFKFIDAAAARVPAAVVSTLAALPAVRFVSPDGPVRTADYSADKLDNVYPLAGRSARLWKSDLLGSGVGVAVVDTGVSAVADLSERLATRVSVNPGATTIDDRHGHGTHVAGIIAGDGTRSQGRKVGVAPGVKLVAIKASDDAGVARERDLLAAFEWVYQNRTAYDIRVLNLSSTAAIPQSYLTSPLAVAAEKLWSAGVVVVVAAGNRGSERTAVWHPPANDPFVIAVGGIHGTADNTGEYLASWSSRGKTLEGLNKPDIVAPGRQLVATLAPGSLIMEQRPDRVSSDGHYVTLSGTSMATPVVAGTVAQLLQQKPDLTPNQVKWLLLSTARTYAQQPEGTANAIDAEAAHKYLASGSPLDSANKSAVRSPAGLIGTLPAEVSALVANWDNVYWDNVYWDNVYWDNVYWDNVYWDNAYWD